MTLDHRAGLMTSDATQTRLADLLRVGNNRPSTFPLSFAQERLWFLEQMTPGNSFYNIPTAVRVRAPLVVGALRRSLNAVVARHESLRTSFAAVDGRPVQRVTHSLKVPLPVHDLRALLPAERDAEVIRLAAEEARRPFDLTTGPLIRARVARLDRVEYVFFLTMHHIISDGWSMGILFDELRRGYVAFATGRRPSLPDLPLQYGEYAVWQREMLAGEAREDLVAYWRTQLADVPVLELPLDRPRPAVQRFRGSAVSLVVPEPVARALESLAHREGSTLFMVLLAAFQALLARYCGQDDVAVGTYLAGRTRVQTERLIGFFINTVVLRTRTDGDPSFTELLRRVREVALDAYAHQDLPFAKLVEELAPERDLSRNPMFQVVLHLFNAPAARHETGADADPVVGATQEASLFDLVVTLCETRDGLVGQVEYDTDLFDRATVTQLARHYVTLLDAIARCPDQPVSTLPMLNEHERQRILVEWNRTAITYDRGSVVALFEAQVDRTPDAIAFVSGDSSLSYVELDGRANRLAHHLRRLGVGPEVVVGVCVDRGLELAVALLAILKAGGAYLPLDPTYPDHRLAFMLDDARAGVLVTNDTLAASFSPSDRPVVRLDTDRTAIAAELEGRLDIVVGPDALAYVIYTSGSTGQPKGVAVEHRQILNRLTWMWDAYPFAREEVGCQKTAASFVDSLWEFLGPLLQGVPTVILADEVVRDPRALVDAMAEVDVSRVWLVPSLLRALLDAYPDLDRRLPRLGFWVSSGEPLTRELRNRFEQQLPHAVLYNLYGTSEVWDATWHDPREDPRLPYRVPIGRPIQNVRTYVLDRHAEPVPLGAIGELYVGGEGVARGYVNQPELTAASFVPDPFAADSAARLYRTGDLVRQRRDGAIEYVARADHQLKIRGHRVEPAEVEAALATHPAVREVAVVAREDQPGDVRLVAYVRVSEPHLAPAELRRFLRELLPEYLLPGAFVVVDAFPLTPSGKLDRRALPPPATAEGASRYVAPKGALEIVLAELWGSVLRLEQVGVDDDFFNDLGGHSLLATQLASQVRETLHVDLPLRSLFEQPTVAGMAAVLGSDAAMRHRVAKTAEILVRLTQLSDSEVDSMLSRRSRS